MTRAFDLGITHFDTARFYGDGLSERALGSWLRGRRHAVTIASKFGLLPTPFIGDHFLWSSVARKGRSLLNKVRLVRYPRRSYSPEALEYSIVASLKALRTDYIDMYLVHEPLVNSAIGEELIDALERKKAAGMIRNIGVAGSQIERQIARYGSRLDIIQTGEHDWQPTRFVPDLTYSVFSAGQPVEGRRLNAESAKAMLTRALARRQNGAVIVQTRRVQHLEQIAVWAGDK